MARRNVGRLELTWANKNMRLLSHGDDSYEWVDPTDWRVAEVRLLRPVGQYGDPTSSNLLIRGDALHALTALTSLPEVAAKFVGKVKLAYLDPPFNTGLTFAHYDDAVEHSVWLTMLRDRLLQIRKLLRPDGSVWVHLDDSEAHRARSVLDEVFGADNFVATVIWEKTDSPRMDSKGFSSAHDYIHCYRRSDAWAPNRHNVEAEFSDFPHVDDQGRRYSRRELRKWGKGSLREDRPKLWYPIEAPDGSEVWPVRPDGKDGRWRWAKATYEENIERIEWVDVRAGLEPYVKTHMDAGKRPKPPKDIWPVTFVGGNPTARAEIKALFPGIEPFATPKPEALIAEVLHIGSEPGDLVLDPFAGSATTAAVAQKMGRRWITIELSKETVDTFARPRLIKVVNGEDLGGVSQSVAEEAAEDLPEGISVEQAKVASKVVRALVADGYFDDSTVLDNKSAKEFSRMVAKAAAVTRTTINHWSGGGGFREVEVSRSMFEEVEGVVVLADWAIGGELAEAVCAQVGYRYEPDAPFVGRRGRSRLAVLDGMITVGVADYLVANLDENETLLVTAQALEPGIDDYLRKRCSGSKARKIPRDLARAGVLPSRLVRLASKSSKQQVNDETDKPAPEVVPV